MTIVLDSSGWIELRSGSSRAKLYQPAQGWKIGGAGHRPL